MKQPAEERFWSKVDRRSPDECWPWMASQQGQGYGAFWFDGRQIPAHRGAYEFGVGPIPPGKTVEHACHTRALKEGDCPGGPCEHRACCNPAHLELLSMVENVRLGAGFARTHCPQGHLYDGENTYVSKGIRHCKTCTKEFKRQYRERRRIEPCPEHGPKMSRDVNGWLYCQPCRASGGHNRGLSPM